MAEMSISYWLSRRDAWSIYDAEGTLSDLDEKTELTVHSGIKVGRTPDVWIVRNGPKLNIEIYAMRADRILSLMADRGLGGTFDPDGKEWFVIGHQLANNLAMLVAGKVSTKIGRGSSFQENIAIIAEVENAKVHAKE